MNILLRLGVEHPEVHNMKHASNNALESHLVFQPCCVNGSCVRQLSVPGAVERAAEILAESSCMLSRAVQEDTT
eukprot:944288-Amphidinium_carterae.1